MWCKSRLYKDPERILDVLLKADYLYDQNIDHSFENVAAHTFFHVPTPPAEDRSAVEVGRLAILPEP